MFGVHTEIPIKEIADFCQRWQITELALFGSVLRNDFRPDSDIDVLVMFAPDVHWSLFDFVRMQRELTAMFGREVDLVERDAVIEGHNAMRRKAILDSAQVIYVA